LPTRPYAIFSTLQGIQNPDTKPTLQRAKNANAQPTHPRLTNIYYHQSVVIMEVKFELQRLDDENFWVNLTQDKIEFLKGVVKPLFRTVAGIDFKAMRFEKDIVEVSLSHLADEKDKFETLKESIIEIIGELPLSVNIVAKEKELIRQAQTNNFWATITEEKFDQLILKLSPMMKFREAIVPLLPAKFNFKDVVSEKEL